MPHPPHAQPRDWLTFDHPDKKGETVRADLTWLLSRWSCIFGNGCKGIVPETPEDGCCSHGAYFSNGADRKRVETFAKQLTPGDWQRYGTKRVVEVGELDDKPAKKTRAIDGSCVFLNKPDFEGGMGCALHAMALRTGLHPLETKPDVCWQLPIWCDTIDGVTTVSEYSRLGWGEGGEDFHWWCTEDAAAYAGKDALYISYGPELAALLGEAVYARLAELCAEREGRVPVLPALKLLPLTVV